MKNRLKGWGVYEQVRSFLEERADFLNPALKNNMVAAHGNRLCIVLSTFGDAWSKETLGAIFLASLKFVLLILSADMSTSLTSVDASIVDEPEDDNLK